MEIKFTEEAAEAVIPRCFAGDRQAALEHAGRLAVERADSRGDSWAFVAGKRVKLKVVITSETWIHLRPLVRYTTAPEAYDGFGTKTVGPVGEWRSRFTSITTTKPVRRVEIRPEHLRWHEQRYASGLHPTWTEDQYLEEIKYGNIVTKEQVPPCRETCERCGDTFDCFKTSHDYEDEPVCPACERSGR